MHPFAPDTVFRLRSDLVTEEIDGELLVLDLEGNHYFGLNATGRHIWQSVAKGHTLGQILEELADHFDVERAALERDTAHFLAQAQAQGLVQPLA